MNRRSFIKSASGLITGAIAMPYILPSGRLFAQTASRKAEHVILVLFAGGLRQQESVLQRYLSDSQGEDIPGNVLYNLMDGPPPETKIVYGTDGSRAGENPIPAILPNSLQSQGTLFPELRTYNVAHFGGLNICLQGNDAASQGLKRRPVYPTVFEYLRRHAGLPASKVWFVGSGIGSSIPLLSHSEHEDYGIEYGANFLAPSMIFSPKGFEYLQGGKSYHPEEELSPIFQLKDFLNLQFPQQSGGIGSLGNTEAEQIDIQRFIEEMFEKTQKNEIRMPVVRDNQDLRTIGYACEVLARFKPNLTVVNLENMDDCHGNFTSYLQNIHRADHAVGFLWDFIQSNLPEMAKESIIMLAPECGRNLLPNPIRDENDWFGYDHADENSRRVFGLMAGKNIPQNLSIGQESNPIGLTADLVPTIADVFGIKETVMQQGYLHPGARSWFDRI